MSDCYTEAGARLLCKTINAYWRDRGFDRVRPESYRLIGGKDWGVRSNLVAGLPPGWKSLAQRRREFLG